MIFLIDDFECYVRRRRDTPLDIIRDTIESYTMRKIKLEHEPLSPKESESIKNFIQSADSALSLGHWIEESDYYKFI